MSTHDYNIANGTGAAVRADINSVLAAIVSKNSSATPPATTFAYMWWFDTSTQILKIRDAANTNWVNVASLTGTTWKLYWNGALLDSGFVAQVSASVPSIQAGLLSGRPAAGTAGRLYIATDTKEWYRDTGSAWDDLFTTDVANAGGVPSISADILTNRPAAGTVGRIFIQTDSPYDIFRDNGASWDTLSTQATAPPVSGLKNATLVGAGSFAPNQITRVVVLETLAFNVRRFYWGCVWQIQNNGVANSIINVAQGVYTSIANQRIGLVFWHSGPTSATVSIGYRAYRVDET